MWLLIRQWGWAALTPTDTAVLQWLDGFTAFETRYQHVTISAHEILIEEPIMRREIKANGSIE